MVSDFSRTRMLRTYTMARGRSERANFFLSGFRRTCAELQPDISTGFSLNTLSCASRVAPLRVEALAEALLTPTTATNLRHCPQEPRSAARVGAASVPGPVDASARHKSGHAAPAAAPQQAQLPGGARNASPAPPPHHAAPPPFLASAPAARAEQIPPPCIAPQRNAASTSDFPPPFGDWGTPLHQAAAAADCAFGAAGSAPVTAPSSAAAFPWLAGSLPAPAEPAAGGSGDLLSLLIQQPRAATGQHQIETLSGGPGFLAPFSPPPVGGPPHSSASTGLRSAPAEPAAAFPPFLSAAQSPAEPIITAALPPERGQQNQQLGDLLSLCSPEAEPPLAATAVFGGSTGGGGGGVRRGEGERALSPAAAPPPPLLGGAGACELGANPSVDALLAALQQPQQPQPLAAARVEGTWQPESPAPAAVGAAEPRFLLRDPPPTASEKPPEPAATPPPAAPSRAEVAAWVDSRASSSSFSSPLDASTSGGAGSFPAAPHSSGGSGGGANRTQRDQSPGVVARPEEQRAASGGGGVSGAGWRLVGGEWVCNGEVWQGERHVEPAATEHHQPSSTSPSLCGDGSEESDGSDYLCDGDEEGEIEGLEGAGGDGRKQPAQPPPAVVVVASAAPHPPPQPVSARSVGHAAAVSPARPSRAPQRQAAGPARPPAPVAAAAPEGGDDDDKVIEQLLQLRSTPPPASAAASAAGAAEKVIRGRGRSRAGSFGPAAETDEAVLDELLRLPSPVTEAAAPVAEEAAQQRQQPPHGVFTSRPGIVWSSSPEASWAGGV